MPVNRLSIAGSPYLGVYLRVSDRGVVASPSLSEAAGREVERLFGVPVIRTTVLDSELVGSFLALNSFGAIVAEEPDARELQRLDAFGPVTVVRTLQNALGNNVLANDLGALLHPSLSDAAATRIGEALRVPVTRGTVAGLGTVGMAAVATNRGVVVHPRATDAEAAVLRETLKVPVHRSTANFGVPIVGACVTANSRGILAGSLTTPVEFVHLQEGFQILE
ncbi:MAG: translation initiation factor IF-6 [Thermoplasmata archaeon]|nr:translation initiation factor IF-6 [Thermoplasmata archaeon]